jgi:predicted SAM-dependent methyltransferase
MYFGLKKLTTMIPLSLRVLKARETLKKFKRPYKLNIGCGHVVFTDGWVNIDLRSAPNLIDISWNVSNKMSFLDNDSCEFIYNEHFLEHLNIECAKIFLSESFRILEPGGIIRIAMPSLDLIIQKYCSEDWRNQSWLKLPEYQFIQTKAEMLNIAFRWWGHCWLYDQEELERRLKEAGFENIKYFSNGESDAIQLQNRETRDDSLLILEAKK